MCTCKDKTIDTIFYFAPTKAEYESYRDGNEIDARTIAFVAETGEIYKNNRLYGKMSKEDFKKILEEILVENPYVLPIATKYTGGADDHIGGVMAGEYISLNTNNGTISVDVSELVKNPQIIEKIKNTITNTITKQYIENSYTPQVATYKQRGVVQIQEGGGILVNGGLISIDPKTVNTYKPKIEIKNGYWYIDDVNTGVEARGPKGEDGKDGVGGTSNVPDKYIVRINPRYKLTTTLTAPAIEPLSGWSTSALIPSGENKYLWVLFILEYSSGGETYIGPMLAGSLGEKGDTGPTGPGGGFNPATDTYIQEIRTKVIHDYNWIKGLQDGEVASIEELVGIIDEKIKENITNMITDADWIRTHYDEGVITPTVGWDDQIKAYMIRVGEWEEDQNGNIITKWSDIESRVDSIVADVQYLAEDPEGKLTALRSALELFTSDSEASASLNAFWAETDKFKKVIAWMYSGLTGVATSDHTYNDLISAANSEWGHAAANLHTEVIRMLDGSYVAKGSLISELNGEIASGMLSQADPSSALASLFSSVKANEDRCEELNTSINSISSAVDPLNPYTQGHMISEATIYEVAMTTYTEPNTGQTIEVPILVNDNGESYQYGSNQNKAEYKHLKYVQDTDNGTPLWIVTNLSGVTVGGTEYAFQDVIAAPSNPSPGDCEPKKKIKYKTTSGLTTYADIRGAYAEMSAELGDKVASVKAFVDDITDVSGVWIKADKIKLDADATEFITALGQALQVNTAAISNSLVVGTPAEQNEEPNYSNVGAVVYKGTNGFSGYKVGYLTKDGNDNPTITTNNTQVDINSTIGGGSYVGNGGCVTVVKKWGSDGERWARISGGGLTFWPSSSWGASGNPDAVYGYDNITLYDSTDRNIYTRITPGRIELHGPNGESNIITYAS